MTVAADLVEAMAVRQPQVVTLAENLSLALRVETHLLREARLRLPGVGPEIEADLWFSPLVRDRTPTGLVLDPDVQAVLRERLRTDDARLQEAWALIDDLHGDLPAAVRMEERLHWHALNRDEDAMRETLRSCIAALTDPERAGVASWAADAMTRVPEAVRNLEEYDILRLGAAVRTGYYGNDLDMEGFDEEANWRRWFAPPDPDRITLGIALIRDGVEIGPPNSERYSHSISVLKQNPISLKIQGNNWSRAIRVQPDRPNFAVQDSVLFDSGHTIWPHFPVEEVNITDAEGRRWAVTQQKSRFIQPNPPPRVHLSYTSETFEAVERVELPFVMGVMSDLSGGNRHLPTDFGFIDFSVDNFDIRIAQIAPRAVLNIEGLESKIDLTFRTLDDFTPEGIVKRVPTFEHIAETRNALKALLAEVKNDDWVRKNLTDALARLRSSEIRRLPRSRTRRGTKVEDEFSALLTKAFRSSGGLGATRIEEVAQALVRGAMEGKGVADIAPSITQAIHMLENQLSRVVNAVLHHADFQKLEAAWRGLLYLVSNTSTAKDLRIRVLDIGREEIADLVRSYNRLDSEENPLFRALYEAEFGQLGGQPYGAIIVDDYFSHAPEDLDVLKSLASLGTRLHAPIISAASPDLFLLQDWSELDSLRPLQDLFAKDDYGEWHDFRRSEVSRHLFLTAPRFLGRELYEASGPDNNRLSFKERNDDPECLLWINSAYAMGHCVTRSFSNTGWFAHIRGIETGGALAGLPVATIDLYDDEYAKVGPAEITISVRHELDLSNTGLVALCNRRDADTATFVSCQSVYQGEGDIAAPTNSIARLHYVLILDRFVHYLKCIVRDWVGRDLNPRQFQRNLMNWLAQYVDASPDASSEEIKAQRPLKDAAIEVFTDETSGRTMARLTIVPHYQFEGMEVPLTATFDLPYFGASPA